MRNRFTPLVVLLMMLAAAPALASGTSIVFFGGMNFAKVSGKSATFAPKNKLGFVGGAGLIVPYGSTFSIVPEVGYAMRGFSWGKQTSVDLYGNPTGGFEVFTSTQVLTFSCSARADFQLAGSLSANVSLGPTLGIETAERYRNSAGGSADDNYLRDSDLGLLAAAGVQVPAGPGRAGLTARWVQGFSDLSRDPAITRHTQDFELLASYTGPLGR